MLVRVHPTLQLPAGDTQQYQRIHFRHQMKRGKNTPQCSRSGQSCQHVYSSLLHLARLSFRQIPNGFPGEYSMWGTNADSQVVLPSCRQRSIYIIPMKSLHFSLGELTHTCTHLCWQAKEPYLIPETYLIEQVSCLMSLQVRQGIERWWSRAALLMKKRKLLRSWSHLKEKVVGKYGSPRGQITFIDM